MSSVVSLIKDLMLGSQIRGACESQNIEYLPCRSNDSFGKAMEKLEPTLIIIDLNIPEGDPFQAISEAQKKSSVKRIACFYSHVDQEVADKAQAMGVTEIYRRSQFFSNIYALVSASPTEGQSAGK